MKKILLVIIIINFLFFASLVVTRYSTDTKIITKENPIKPVEKPLQEIQISIKKYEPQWTNYPPKNTTQRKSILTDVISHAGKGESYTTNDQCTVVHETTHGICKRKETEYGFYCLENRMCYVSDVNTTLATIAEQVPPSLRGQSYDLYLKKQQYYFNNDPIYLFDEWVAYTNGSACIIELTQQNKYREQRWDTILFMREFDVYALTLAYVTKPTDEQFKNFLGWQLERTATLYNEARKYPNLTHSYQENWLKKLRTSPDAEKLRQFTRDYLGKEWTKRVLNF